MPSRLIKYRGKIDGEWWYVTPDDDRWRQFWILVNKETVGQYINIKDKNDHEIYEGDFVITENSQNEDEYSRDEEYSGIVTYENDGYCINQSHSKYKPALCNIYIISIEVIGNIWEQQT